MSGGFPVYLLRHGRVAGGEGLLLGQRDLPLGEDGRAQLVRAAGRLNGLGLRGIATSPLARCRESAAIVAARLELPCGGARLRESPWRLRGLSPAQPGTAFPRVPPAGETSRLQAPGGKLRHLAARVRGPLRRLAAGAAGPLLLVGHAGVHRVLLCGLLGLPLKNLFRLPQDHAGLTRLVPDGAGGWRLAWLNLPLGGEPDIFSPARA